MSALQAFEQELLDLRVEPTAAELHARRLLAAWNRASTHYANHTTPHRLARAIRLGQVAWPACRAAGVALPRMGASE